MRTFKKILAYFAYYFFLRIFSMLFPTGELLLLSQQFYDRFIKKHI